jgi:hypothetical protein
LLTPKEFAEDAFWLGFAALLWIPLYDDFYQTPLSEAFTWLRDRSPLDITLAPTTVTGVERQLPWPVSDNYLGRFKAAQEG